MTASSVDHRFMAGALRLARHGLNTADPNPRVGCVIVRDDEVVGEGWHAMAGGPHAEVLGIEQAGDAASGATAYVTLEPCCHHGRTPPCTDALLAAGIGRVVIATQDPNPEVAGAGAARLAAAGIQVETGVLEAEARALNIGFFQRMETGRPYVRSKIAASLDGRTALANGVSQWITGEAAREDVQRLRARSSAILTGVGTVLADDPSLTVRSDAAAGGRADIRQPLRVIADSGLRTPPDSKTLGLPGQVRIFCVQAEAESLGPLEAAGAVVEIIENKDGVVALPALMARLAALEINELLVEAGPTLNGALLQAGLLDEVIVYMAGCILGADAQSMFAIPELSDMSDRNELEFVEMRRIGADCRLTYRSR